LVVVEKNTNMTQKKILGEWVTLPKKYRQLFIWYTYLSEVLDWAMTIGIGVISIGGIIYMVYTW
jgi:hypothetical protein